MSIQVPLILARSGDSGGRRQREPVRFGVPFAPGAWSGAGDVQFVDAQAPPTPVQWTVLDRWADGSCRWALVDLLADTAAAAPPSGPDTVAETAATLRIDPAGQPAAPSAPLAREAPDEILVDTGVAQWRLARRGQTIVSDVTVNGIPTIDARRTRLVALDETGQSVPLTIASATIEEAGPIRAVVAIEGELARSDGARLLSVIIRLHFVRGHAHTEWHLTVRNPRRASHEGGFWDLGDGGSVFVKDLALTLACAEPAPPPLVRCSAEAGSGLADCGDRLELYQDGSGGENWRSSNHLNRKHEIPVSFRGYRLRTARGDREGLRATPVVTLQAGPHLLGVAVRRFWENCPKAIEAGRDGLTLRFFPGQYADLHEIQGGEQKTHVFTVAFGADAVGDLPLAWHRAPLRVRATPDWYAEAEAGPYLTPRATDRNQGYLDLVDAAITGRDTFIDKREVIDEYGWRHFGELYGDHEGVFRTEPPPLVSHYNNQYDVVAGFAYQFMRSGDWRWWVQCEDMAAHVTDIDIYHTDEDKSAYNHGLFWHTYHYVDADTGTHRSYPKQHAAIVKGGGPSAEQNYAAGLMLHYFMTGDRLSREAALGLAQFVIDIDDGRKTVFRWLDGGDTGIASASGVLTYQGPGRGSANSIAALLVGHRITGEARFLDKAEQIIRRCIHPDDDIAARELLDAERRWYYNMFLQSLGAYLDHKAQLGAIDERYAYARACLLHYVRWMASHEYPYLEKPEILQYPNETWAAQDMRKSQVFKFAARHAEGEERARFLERSQFFFDYSVGALTASPRRTLARPVVLLLTNGFMHAWFQRGRAIDAPRPVREPASYGRPQTHVPQRVRAIARAKKLLAAGAGLFALLVLILAVILWRW